MARKTGDYRVTRAGGESVRAFVPLPLPPADPPLRLDADTAKALTEAMVALGKLAVAEEDFAREGANYAGLVRTHGELWKALSPAPVAAGQAVEVQDRQGLALLVQAVSQPSLPDATGESTKTHDVH